MRRWSSEHIEHVARDFSRSSQAEAWHFFGARIRRAILDSVVMDEMRIADSVDSEIALTAGEIIDFRTALEAKLAEGVKRRSAPPLRFRVDDE